MPRLVVVSNRLPITVKRVGAGVEIGQSSGGLATGLRSAHGATEGLWIGWSGLAGEPEPALADSLAEQYRALRIVPVTLTADEVERYYEGYSNGLLWPLFHSFLGQLPLDVADYPAYVAANERFADAVLESHREGDLIWVHDYQLMLVPRMVRERAPTARIGFFLHIPFPSSETFRTLPCRRELLEGLLGADLIGFHTAAYMRNFVSSSLHVLGAAADVDKLRWRGRATSLGVFPMGIDARGFAARASSAAVAGFADEFRGGGGQRLLVGIDRLDYTKGIPRRLLAFERLLERQPELHGKVRLVQVAVPSRTTVDAYAEFRTQVDALVGRINGRFGTPHWAPVHYLYRSLSEDQVVALYRVADVMLVTPIRDGMNLVAKEFCASRVDELGVLVLSEFAGAASELGEAILVNPYDVDETAAAIGRALALSEEEQGVRMRMLRERVLSYDVYRWTESFVGALEQASASPEHVSAAFTSRAFIDKLVTTISAAEHLVLLIDYDGTLVPIAAAPDLARPSERLRRLLRQLAERPRTEVHIVSGRAQENLDRWLGDLPLHLHAEHGFWSRGPRSEWVGREQLPTAWRGPALKILRDFAERTPGSLIEEKRTGVAWHYRGSDPEYGLFQANELKAHLAALLTNAPVELLSGDKVIELRAHGTNKGVVAREILAGVPGPALTVAFGDDTTDEDMFAALDPSALAFHVGATPSRAPYRLSGVPEVERVLGLLVASRSA
ncbi:MAG: bifunctional alpha,alpha-trehalose-phosphate synthase (UDP-forming)/trehalose-phosphatase [Polyangiaceae bacterium]